MLNYTDNWHSADIFFCKFNNCQSLYSHTFPHILSIILYPKHINLYTKYDIPYNHDKNDKNYNDRRMKEVDREIRFYAIFIPLLKALKLEKLFNKATILTCQIP